ncbi:MAG: aromatic-ring-hydroxylating dioxygenase subunit beta [Alphaproteobacteria bacterium]|nr:aromatic-ring-hydroxylating dioxygenase subunit beta [Alphaproteobacteria bacterium]
MSDETTSREVGDKDYVAIQRFLFREAACLDRRAFDAWLDLIADDIVYRVTQRVVRDADAPAIDTAIVDEDAIALRARVEQIKSPRLTRAENPPSFTRRFVSNVEAREEGGSEYFVESNILLFRTRSNVPEGSFYAGERHDILRRTRNGLRLARRTVRLDQAVLMDGVLSTLL